MMKNLHGLSDNYNSSLLRIFFLIPFRVIVNKNPVQKRYSQLIFIALVKRLVRQPIRLHTLKFMGEMLMCEVTKTLQAINLLLYVIKVSLNSFRKNLPRRLDSYQSDNE